MAEKTGLDVWPGSGILTLHYNKLTYYLRRIQLELQNLTVYSLQFLNASNTQENLTNRQTLLGYYLYIRLP